MRDLFDYFDPDKVLSPPQWTDIIANEVKADEMLCWFSELIKYHQSQGIVKFYYFTLYAGSMKRFLDMAYFSQKLLPSDRELFKDQAETIFDLIKTFWGGDQDLMQALDKAIAESNERYKIFGWPSSLPNVASFKEI